MGEVLRTTRTVTQSSGTGDPPRRVGSEGEPRTTWLVDRQPSTRRKETPVSEATIDAQQDVHGPVDFLLIQFPMEKLTGEVAPRLADLVESGIIRIYDLLVISKS